MPNYDVNDPLILHASRYAYVQIGGRETPTEQFYTLGGIRSISFLGPRSYINGSHKGTGFPIYIEESNMADRTMRLEGYWMRDKDERAFAPTDVDVGTDTITIPAGFTFTENERVRFGTDGTLPAPLVGGTNYYVASPTSTTLQLKSNYDSPSPVDLTDQGSGAEHRIWRRGPMDDLAQAHSQGRWINIKYFGVQFQFLSTPPVGAANAYLVLELDRVTPFTEFETFRVTLQSSGSPINWNTYPGPLSA